MWADWEVRLAAALAGTAEPARRARVHQLLVDAGAAVVDPGVGLHPLDLLRTDAPPAAAVHDWWTALYWRPEPAWTPRVYAVLRECRFAYVAALPQGVEAAIEAATATFGRWTWALPRALAGAAPQSPAGVNSEVTPREVGRPPVVAPEPVAEKPRAFDF